MEMAESGSYADRPKHTQFLVATMQNLLKTRWKERDIALQERFLRIVEEMNGRGMLYSTVMVQEMYKVARDEFVGSRQTIVSTIIDSLMAETVRLEKERLMSFAIRSLENRRQAIDGLFRARASVSGVLDSPVLKDHIDLASQMDGAVTEVRVELIRALDEYQSRNDSNHKDRILHKLINIPVVAWLVIVVMVVAALVSFASDIVSLFKGN